MPVPSSESPLTSPQRTIRSFVLRTGRTTVAQAKALETLGPQWRLPFRAHQVDYVEVFGRKAPCILEIGFGMGEATADIARSMPNINFLACEVHTPGVGALLMRLQGLGLPHVRIIQHDAVEVLRHMVPDASLAGVHIFFPDPWPKKRHHKRRLIQPEFVRLIAQKLAPQGKLHCATDWQEYAQHMLVVMQAEPSLCNTAPPSSGYVPRPSYRPVTKFETRGQGLGHGVWDLVFSKR